MQIMCAIRPEYGNCHLSTWEISVIWEKFEFDDIDKDMKLGGGRKGVINIKAAFNQYVKLSTTEQL